MSKSVTEYVCTDCGWNGLKWYGRCPNCNEWGTIKEFRRPRLSGSRSSLRSTATPVVAVVNSMTPSTSAAVSGNNTDFVGSLVSGNDATSRNNTNIVRNTGIGHNADTRNASINTDIHKTSVKNIDATKIDTAKNIDIKNIDINSADATKGGNVVASNWASQVTQSSDMIPSAHDTANTDTNTVIHANSAFEEDADENYEEERFSTGFSEFDRVLGGGIVPGSVTLIAGSPGIGKSTLLLASASKVAHLNKQVLYISGEESTGQICMRARRIGALNPHLSLASTTELESAIELIEHYRPQLVILDSVQTITTDTNNGMLGGASQVREVTRIVVNTAKQLNIPIFLIGHVTKDGTVAGPRTLEHLVDVVCQFEGDPQIALRMIRAQKNRFGPTDEVGCFDMTDEGLEEVTDPSGLFISQSDVPSEGTCITFTMDGHRSMPIEIQALTTETALPAPRRAVNGVDFNRISMLIAVLYKHGGINLLNKDIYISTIAGAQAKEPACDLAICAALSSAATGHSINRTTSALGEVSLTGEVRPIPRIAQRLVEAQRMGFTKILIPAHQNIRKIERFKDIDIIRVATVRTALKELGITGKRLQSHREEF